MQCEQTMLKSRLLTCFSDHVGHELGCNRLPPLGLAVCPGIAKVRHLHRKRKLEMWDRRPGMSCIARRWLHADCASVGRQVGGSSSAGQSVQATAG